MADASASGSSSSDRSSVLWMMVAFLGGLTLLVGGALFLAQRVIKTMSIKRPAGEATLQTPLGELRVEQPSAHGPGLPVYPQAALVMPGDNVPSEFPADRRYEIRTAKYHSPDSRETVDAWYRARLGPEFERQGPGEKHVSAVEQYKLGSDDVAFVLALDDETRIVTLADENNGTGITLVRIGRLHAK